LIDFIRCFRTGDEKLKTLRFVRSFMNSTSLPYNHTLFWDVDPSKMDPVKHSDFIIQRVFMRGDWEDYLYAKKQFSKNEIIEALTNARYLDKKTLHFASLILQLPLTAFRCYTTELSSREHWNY